MAAVETSAARCLDRGRVYRALARLFSAPDRNGLDALRGAELGELCAALDRLAPGSPLADAAREVAERALQIDLDCLERSYQASFDASSGPSCPPTETSYTADSPQRALLRTFELADVAGFYRAFGVETAPGSERPDHVAVELEFMHLLAVKEGIARGEPGGAEGQVQVCRDAARAFLRDHLARFVPLFAERLATSGAHPLYAAAGRLLEGVVARDAELLEAG